MKTTIELSDSLLEKAKRRARRENRTLREIVEESLRKLLGSEPERRAFRLKTRTFRGKGVQRGMAEGDWQRIRELIYSR
jgi:predicted transcriptional regulator